MESTKYAVLSKLSNAWIPIYRDNKFRRYTGLHRNNFEIIKLIIEQYEQGHKIKSGRPATLCIEDQILMLLEYYRENRTFFHLGISYQGVQKLHPKTDLPKKKSKNNPLSKEDKQNNRQLANERVYVEHANQRCKVFKLLKNHYRSHSRFGLRATPIATFVNANAA